MKNQFFKTFFISIFSMLLICCKSTQYISIDKGKIDDNFEMKILGEYSNDKTPVYHKFDSRIIITPNTFFSLKGLGLKDNNTVGYATFNFYSYGVYSYDISIYNDEYKKTFYGRIAFFNAPPSVQNQAVTRYYEIKIPDNYFSEAIGGRTSVIYEYYKSRYSNSPTWIISLSDVPIK